MRRTSTLSLEGFDPDVIEAAREVAQRAGVPLETWIASVVSPEKPAAKPAASRQRSRAAARDSSTQAVPASPAAEGSASSAADDSAPVAPPKAKPAKQVAAEPTKARMPDPAPEPAASIPEMMRRLDALDRSLNEERNTQRAEAPAEAKIDVVAERLAEIERRMGDLAAQITGPRPLGRRGRPIAAEMREAVDEVRRRQRELDSDGSAQDRPVRADADAAVPSPAIAELQAETARLRESLGSLATGRDVGALERAMRSLSDDVQRSRDPAEFAAPIETMRRQVEKFAEEFADNVHSRLAGEVERLANRADGTLDGSAPSHADRSALDAVHHELDEIRQLIGSLAGPERIQSLAQGVQAMSGQIADLQSRVDVNPVRDLIGRLESIGETLHRPAAPSPEIASMHTLLRGIAEKVDRVGSGGGNLDALENHVVSLAQRLDTRASDPAVASLERTMGELLTQIASLRDDGSVEAAVERATRRALAEVGGASGLGSASGKIDAFRADLDDLRVRQISADQRMQATMDSLNAVLSKLVDRLGITDAVGPLARASASEENATLGEHLRASTSLSVPKLQTIPVSAPQRRANRRPEPAVDTAAFGDELLEPGASRPVPPRGAAPEASGAAPGGDIKSSFIAAARRAAQAAQADLAAETPAAPERREASRPRVGLSAPGTPGVVGRLLGGFEKRRRPLILGLAAVVLVLGALQAYQMSGAPGQSEPAGPVAAAPPPAVEPPAVEASAALSAPVTPAPAATVPASGPQTTQSIVETGSAGPKTAPNARIEDNAPASVQAAIPKVPSIASLGRELASVPAGLATLKQAAQDGDGAAIYELAAREADGRGMPRDLAIAAKLYEKLADAGYAPAQFKLGSFYEKGSGVLRDIAQAKTWYGRAADRGNIRAMHNLAVLHAENPGASGKPDFATASSWFRRAAEYGVRDSQYNLAVLYARGLGVGQDLVQSYTWFSAAAAQGDEEAGKKRDEVAAKLQPKDLLTAKAVASAYKPKAAEPAANDMPAAKPAAPAAMSLIGAPPPGSPASSFAHAGPRTGV